MPGQHAARSLVLAMQLCLALLSWLAFVGPVDASERMAAAGVLEDAPEMQPIDVGFAPVASADLSGEDDPESDSLADDSLVVTRTPAAGDTLGLGRDALLAADGMGGTAR